MNKQHFSPSFLLNIAKAQNSDEIDQILMSEKLITSTQRPVDDRNWECFGNDSSNASKITNGDTTPEKAIVEKIVNGMEQYILREVLYKKMSDPNFIFPKTFTEVLLIPEVAALKSNLDNVIIVTDGKNEKSKNPNLNLAIIDNATGQTLDKVESTLLSIGGKNKDKYPFLLGVYGHGGLEVVRFCLGNKYQLFCTKRDPKLNDNPNTKNNWTWTICRLFDPEVNENGESEKLPIYKYLKLYDGENFILPHFDAESLPLLPTKEDFHGQQLSHGTFIKCFNYQLSSGIRTHITSELRTRLCYLLPQWEFSVKLCERRSGFERTNAHDSTFTSLDDFLSSEDKLEVPPIRNVNSDYCVNLKYENVTYELPLTTYILTEKEAASRNHKWKKNDGIFLSLNGQTHATENKDKFSSAGLDLIKHRLIVVVKCDSLPWKLRYLFFKSDRNGLQFSQDEDIYFKEIKKQLLTKVRETAEVVEILNHLRENLMNGDEFKLDSSIVDELTKDGINIACGQFFSSGSLFKNDRSGVKYNDYHYNKNGDIELPSQKSKNKNTVSTPIVPKPTIIINNNAVSFTQNEKTTHFKSCCEVLVQSDETVINDIEMFINNVKITSQFRKSSYSGMYWCYFVADQSNNICPNQRHTLDIIITFNNTSVLSSSILLNVRDEVIRTKTKKSAPTQAELIKDREAAQSGEHTKMPQLLSITNEKLIDIGLDKNEVSTIAVYPEIEGDAIIALFYNIDNPNYNEIPPSSITEYKYYLLVLTISTIHNYKIECNGNGGYDSDVLRQRIIKTTRDLTSIWNICLNISKRLKKIAKEE